MLRMSPKEASELKIIITEIKNSREGLNNRPELAEESLNLILGELTLSHLRNRK